MIDYLQTEAIRSLVNNPREKYWQLLNRLYLFCSSCIAGHVTHYVIVFTIHLLPSTFCTNRQDKITNTEMSHIR